MRAGIRKKELRGGGNREIDDFFHRHTTVRPNFLQANETKKQLKEIFAGKQPKKIL